MNPYLDIQMNPYHSTLNLYEIFPFIILSKLVSMLHFFYLIYYLFIQLNESISCKPWKEAKRRNLHNYHVIIFYFIYVGQLIENIFRTVCFCFSSYRTIEKLFFVLSYFRFYEINYFCWNLLS